MQKDWAVGKKLSFEWMISDNPFDIYIPNELVS